MKVVDIQKLVYMVISVMKTTVTIKPLSEITRRNIPVTASVRIKRKAAQKALGSRYNVLGVLDRTNDIVVEERFHNVRDEFGRFAAIAR